VPDNESKSIIVNVEHRFVRGDGKKISITDAREVHEAKEFTGPVAQITRSFGVTLNMGNFESTRVDVGIQIPCYLEDVERADEFAREFCEKRLKNEVLALKSDEKKDGPKI